MVCDAIHIENEHDVNFIYIQMGEEVKRYYEWLNFVCEIKGYTDLNEDQLTLLDYLSGDKYFTTAGKKAMAVLNEYYDGNHFVPAYYSDQLAVPRNYSLNEQGQPEVHFIRVYPNPANEFVQVYVTPSRSKNESLQIAIRDNEGGMMELLKINSDNPYLTIDMTSYASGAYQFVLLDKDQILESTTIHVVH